MAKVEFDFNLAPKEAIAYLKDKGFKLSFDYDEIIREAHDKAFTVAKITRVDLLNDVNTSLQDSMINGTPFKEFQKSILPTLQKKGWWGEKEITNPSTGEVKTVKIDSRRLKNIYSTNMRVAYSKARYQEQLKLPNSTYFRYVSALLENTRLDHKALHNVVLPREHKFWDTNYPLNGWGCVCKVMAISKKEAVRSGYKILDKSPKSVASKDWDFNPAKNKVSRLSKIDLDKSLSTLPTIVKDHKYKDFSDEELKDKFFKDLGIKSGDTFIDKLNDPMVLDDELFKVFSHAKTTKRDRHLYIEQFESLIKDPDEIYLEMEKLRVPSEKYSSISHRLIKKFMKYYRTEKGAKKALMGLFEYQKDKTTGVSLYFIDSSNTVEKKRIEKLVYQKSLKQD